MANKILVTLTLASVAMTACGQRSQYKSIYYKSGAAVQRTAIDPKAVNPVAESSAQSQALQILASDNAFKNSYQSDASKAILNEIRGVTLKITNVKGSLNTYSLQFITKSDLTCGQKQAQKNLDTSSLKQLQAIDAKTRLACSSADCSSMLLVLSDEKSILDTSGQLDVQTGSVAILLKKDSDGLLRPATSQARELTAMLSAEDGAKSCAQEVTAAAQKMQQQAAAPTVDTKAKDADQAKPAEASAPVSGAAADSQVTPVSPFTDADLADDQSGKPVPSAVDGAIADDQGK